MTVVPIPWDCDPIGPRRLALVVACSSRRSWRRSEPIDAAQDVGEQVTRHGDLYHLECDVTPVAYDLRADQPPDAGGCRAGRDGDRPLSGARGPLTSHDAEV